MSETSLELKLDRFLKAPRAKIWRAWSDAKHLKEWWCPKPWTTVVKEFDFRPGGGFHTTMSGPDGNGGTGESDNPGCFLEIVPLEKIVTTSQLGGGWRPLVSWLPMTAIVAFADEGDGTRYIARALHVSPEHLKQHEEMGFHEGWGTVAGQLEEYANAL